MSEGQTEASVYQQAENGKTELSLVHFTLKNPRWQPPQDSSLFISHMREKVQQDAQAGPNPQLLLSEAPLCTSLLSNDSATAVSYYITPLSNNIIKTNRVTLHDKRSSPFQPDTLLASVLAHPVLTASGMPGWNRRFVSPSSTASAAASVLASLSSSQQPHTGRTRSHVLHPPVHPQHHEGPMYHSAAAERCSHSTEHKDSPESSQQT